MEMQYDEDNLAIVLPGKCITRIIYKVMGIDRTVKRFITNIFWYKGRTSYVENFRTRNRC